MLSPDLTTGSGERWLTRHWLWVALTILLLAAVARLVMLREVPPGLAQDEVLDADIALFIRGGEHAIFFRHGYGHEPLYHYFAVPFQVLLGDNLLSIRLPAAFLGLVLVALVMRWMRRDFGTMAAAVGGLLLSVGWWPIIFSRIGIRPILEPVLLMAAVLLWPLAAPTVTPRDTTRAVLAGLALGLTLYSYTAARVLFLLPVLVILYWLFRRNSADPVMRAIANVSLRYAALILIITAVVYAPMGLTLRANPDLQQRVDQLEGPLEALRQGDPGPVLQMTAATLGVFSFDGDPRWTYGLPGRPIFGPLTAALFYAGLVIALVRWRDPRYAFLPMWLAVTLLPSALTPDAPSTVRLVGALPVTYALPGIAAAWIIGRLGNRSDLPASRSLGPILVVGLVGILTLSALRTGREGFLRWAGDFETRLKYQTLLRDVGLHWRMTADGVPLVVADAFFEPIDASSLTRNIGRDPAARWVQSGEQVAGALVWPASAQGSRWLYVPEYAPLNPELAAAAGLTAEPFYRSAGRPSFAVHAMPTAPPALDVPLDAGFGPDGGSEAMRLRGSQMLDHAGDGQLSLLTAWRVADALPADLAIFTHLLDEAGTVVAQHDGLDASPATLRVGDEFLQRHVLRLSAGLSDGRYSLRAGLYRRSDGSRWVSADGADGLALGECVVETVAENILCVLSASP